MGGVNPLALSLIVRYAKCMPTTRKLKRNWEHQVWRADAVVAAGLSFEAALREAQRLTQRGVFVGIMAGPASAVWRVDVEGDLVVLGEGEAKSGGGEGCLICGNLGGYSKGAIGGRELLGKWDVVRIKLG